MTRISDAWPVHARQQFWLLLRHFFSRLLYNDAMHFENQQREAIIVFIGILAVSFGYMAHSAMFPYLIYKLTGVTAATAWRPRVCFFTFTMTASAIFSLLNWDNLFLDRRDYIHLMPLPVSLRTLFSAKFASILGMILCVSVACNLFAVFVFALYPVELYHGALLKLGLVHLISNFVANLGAFFSVVFVQNMLLLLCRNKMYRWLAIAVQSLALMALVSIFMWFPDVYKNMETLKETGNGFMQWFPPLWFTGLGEALLGNRDPFWLRHCTLALLVIVPLLAYPVTFPAVYRQLTKAGMTTAVTRVKQRSSRFKASFWEILLFASQAEKGFFHFCRLSLKRSRSHQLLAAIWLAIPAGLFAAQLIFLYANGGWSYIAARVDILSSYTLIFPLMLLLGMRQMMDRPVGDDAAWLFHILPSGDRMALRHAFKKAIWAVVLFPMAVVLFSFYWFVWDATWAVKQTMFAMLVSALIMEAVFFKHRRIPFVSPHVPGRAHLKTRWPFYMIGFFVFISLGINLNLAVLREPLALSAFAACTFIVLFISDRYHRRWLRETRASFAEEPELATLSLDLD